ncbi:hypothetical protein [Oryzibacter oryziterrae]|uniref:hypothetical protein n=1 Tax=Oryzibacter oryziterrae TaxID=2766474 RepID=UPI001F3E950C|nr:hypothetical protein [Oryzibacter oryziterrae]
MADHKLLAAGWRHLDKAFDLLLHVLDEAVPAGLRALLLGSYSPIGIWQGATTDNGFALAEIEASPQTRMRCRRQARRALVCLHVQPDLVLRRDVALPVGQTSSHIHDLLRWNFETWTAFKPDEVWFCGAPLEDDADRLRIAFVERRHLTPILDRLASFGLPIDRLQLSETLVVDLPASRRRRFRSRARLASGLMVLAFLLGSILIASELRQAETRLALRQSEIRRLVDAASAASDAADALNKRQKAIDALAGSLSARPSAARDILQVVDHLPDGVLVESVSWSATILQLVIRAKLAPDELDIRNLDGSAITPVTLGRDQDGFRYQLDFKPGDHQP